MNETAVLYNRRFRRVSTCVPYKVQNNSKLVICGYNIDKNIERVRSVNLG